MAINDSRRKFLADYPLKQIGSIFQSFQDGFEEADQKEEFDKFFDSYESSYALTLAYPDEILLETARHYGIETEGRKKNDIVKELFVKKGGY